jgi:hypothetical protein
MKNLVVLLVCSLFVLGVQAEDKKKGYNILWVRPVKAGEVYFISQNLKLKYTNTSQLNNADLKKTNIFRDLYFDSKVTVKEVGEKKVATDEWHEVIRFYELKEGKQKELLSKGAIIKVKKGVKGKEILVDDKVPEKELLITLLQMIELNAGGPTYNEMMGVCTNVMPGGDWEILKSNIIDSYKAVKINVAPENIKGKCSFEKVENHKLFFSGFFTIDPFEISTAKDRKLLSSKYNYNLYEIALDDESKLPIKITKITKHEYVETEVEKSELKFTTVIEKELAIKYFESEKEMSE